MPPHKIAHILPWPSVGGVELATFRIAQALEGDHFNSTAFCLKGSPPIKEIFASAGFETAEYEPVVPSLRRLPQFMQGSLRLAGEFKRRKIHLVHCSDLVAGLYAVVAGRLAGLPVICHIRGCFEEIPRRDRLALGGVNRFAFVSRHTWQSFGYRVSPRRGTIVYDGMDLPRNGADEQASRSVRLEFNIPERAKIIGMAGHVAPAKDYATLAKAAARVIAAYPDVRFLIIGDHSRVQAFREHYEQVKRMLAASGVASHFIFTDFRDDVLRIIGALDVFVLSTHMEGLPLTVLEAMAHAKPVLATAVGGIPEIVIHQETGLLHAHEDDAELAANIISLLDDETRAAGLGEMGRQLVKAKFNKQQFTTSMANLYREALRIEPQPEAARTAVDTA